MSILNLSTLNHKDIAILGLGVENQALLDYLLKQKLESTFTICDKRSLSSLGELYQKYKKHKNIYWRLEADFNTDLHNFDYLFRAPGWPLHCSGIIAAQKLNKKIAVTSPMNFFFAHCPTKNIIGVTGTKGKGTTSSLIFKILKEAQKKVYLGGNIGIAPINFLNKIKKTDFVVLELSSFQLEDLAYSPKISVITNIYKEHLSPADPNNPNYHKSYADYIKAKLSIAIYQKAGNFLFLNEKSKKVLDQRKFNLGYGRKIYFTESTLPSRLVGNYNKENIAAAVAVAKLLKIKNSITEKAVKNFVGLEHRLEFVTEINGVKYFDNSFATTPESSAMDLDSFSTDIILLAGGADKGASFKAFAKNIKERVKFVLLFAGTGTKHLLAELRKINYPEKNIRIMHDMENAVKIAHTKAEIGDTVLLSTGCASFGLFKNYKERGNLFQKYVKELK
ncbi:MAG: UDP-N-acetylmuramoyl-L-alanine--D-glutamate ligase [Candidatus Falkowbacteria bacterium]